jgi:hypothetical protein
MTYFFETYGCQMNSAESAALVLVCRERGWAAAPDGESADLVLLNTCSVRLTAEQRVLGRIALYASLKKKGTTCGRRFALVVAGCMAQRTGETLKEKFPAVDYVMGTASRSVFPLILEAVENGADQSAKTAFPQIVPEETSRFSFSSSHLEEGQFRSFVPIMHGCNNFCSYCIVPYVRGGEISRDPNLIANDIFFNGFQDEGKNWTACRPHDVIDSGEFFFEGFPHTLGHTAGHNQGETSAAGQAFFFQACVQGDTAQHPLFGGEPHRAGVKQNQIGGFAVSRCGPSPFPAHQNQSRRFGGVHLAAVGLKKIRQGSFKIYFPDPSLF